MSDTEKSPCRLCLDYNSPKINVFNNISNDINITSAIYELFSFWIKTSDGLTKDICLDCEKLVRSFYFFTLKVKESQKILNENNIQKDENNIKIEWDYNAEILNLNRYEENIKQELYSDQINLNCSTAVEDPLNSFKFEENSYSNIRYSDSQNGHPFVKNNAEEINQNQLSEESSYLNFEPSINDDSNDSLLNQITEKEQIQASDKIPKEIYKDGQMVISKATLNRLISNFYNIVCDICENKPRFPKYLDLFEHCKIKHETKGFLLCCNCKMTERKRIVAHMVCHMQPDAFQCRVCRTNFSSPGALSIHMKNTHVPNSEKRHVCDQCEKRYSTAGRLNHHKLMAHTPHDEERKLKCSECTKVFYSQVALKQHMSSIHSGKQFLCPVCGKTLQSKCNLKIHMNVHDATGTNAVQCQECGVIVKSKESLRVHARLQHSRIDLNCELCEYNTRSSTALKRHMITRHSDDKPFVCDVCHKGFKFKTNLRHHSVQHTGEHKYACSFCPRTFAQSGNCYTHRMRMHPEQYKSVRSKKKFANNKLKTTPENV